MSVELHSGDSSVLLLLAGTISSVDNRKRGENTFQRRACRHHIMTGVRCKESKRWQRARQEHRAGGTSASAVAGGGSGSSS